MFWELLTPQVVSRLAHLGWGFSHQGSSILRSPRRSAGGPKFRVWHLWLGQGGFGVIHLGPCLKVFRGRLWDVLGKLLSLGESQVCDALPHALACDEKLPPDQAGLGAAQQLLHPLFQTLCLHYKPWEWTVPGCLHYRLPVFVKLVYSQNTGPSSDLISRELHSCPAPIIWGNESQTGPSDLLGGEDDVQPCTYSLIYLCELRGGWLGGGFCP